MCGGQGRDNPDGRKYVSQHGVDGSSQRVTDKLSVVGRARRVWKPKVESAKGNQSGSCGLGYMYDMTKIIFLEDESGMNVPDEDIPIS